MTAHSDLESQFEKDPWPVVGFLTAEHSSLTTTRSATITEANSRVSSYLTTLSASLVALGFVAAGPGGFAPAFFGFGAALLAMSAVVGVITFIRCVQISVDDLHMLARIERLRNVYVTLLPGLERSLHQPSGPDADVRRRGSMSAGDWAPRPTATQLLLTMAGLVGVVNSAVIGATAACLVQTVFQTPWASWTVGPVTGVLSAIFHPIKQMRMMRG